MNDLHLKPNEKLAKTSARSADLNLESNRKLDDNTQAIKDMHSSLKNDTILGFTGVVKSLKTLKDNVSSPAKVLQKLDEVKSAALVANQELKKIAKKEALLQFPSDMKVSLEGISLIKGDKGDDGVTPSKEKLLSLIRPLIPKVKDGDPGKTPTAQELITLIRPLIPKVKNGETPSDEKLISLIRPLIPEVKNGEDGDDGSPDSPDEVVTKVNSAKKKIDHRQIKGLDKIFNEVDSYGKNPQGQIGGGANAINFLSAGVKISDYVTAINFSTGITATYAGSGVITVTSSGGVGAWSTPVETPVANGSVTVYTVGATPPTDVIADGSTFFNGAGYTFAAGQITFTNGPTQFVRYR